MIDHHNLGISTPKRRFRTTDAAYPAALTAFGPRYRKSPFFEATRRCGCRTYSVYYHTYMPLFYRDPVTNYWHLVEDVTLWDVACERQVEISGPDAAQFVQLLTPRELSKFAVGQCKYGFITDYQGTVNPYELGLGLLVDLSQHASFIGKSTLQLIQAIGVTRRLCGLHIHGDPITSTEQHWLTRSAAVHVSHVTSAVHSPRLEKNIALALVDIEHTTIGAELNVDTEPTISTAIVVKYPFYDPEHNLATGS